MLDKAFDESQSELVDARSDASYGNLEFQLGHHV